MYYVYNVYIIFIVLYFQIYIFILLFTISSSGFFYNHCETKDLQHLYHLFFDTHLVVQLHQLILSAITHGNHILLYSIIKFPKFGIIKFRKFGIIKFRKYGIIKFRKFGIIF